MHKGINDIVTVELYTGAWYYISNTDISAIKIIWKNMLVFTKQLLSES